ncbi:ABC transporter ATP-binding protein [Caulobacter sp. 17J65-9]|uniref:ABC transporter ATP-binding protein n=1 Tax=Caulobacter sp. 17J65-9 TaxID=2709382 RepID=UPI0013CDA1B9|nr:ABC transporter ATP-binding protein [Caulobacter sp. 17J65-9]NEX92764.1 ABC transporter ATP-binding protein [Caulobacter sp. 17J65-9]
MTDDTDIDGAPKRALSNGQVLAFVWRQWMRRPKQFALILTFMLAATACDLSIPWAAGHLVDVVSDPVRRPEVAWGAWATLTGIYALFYGLRQGGFRTMNPFAAKNMEEMTNEAFSKVQGFSSDWHADTFAGSTVRKVSRAMWGYDSVSDVLILMLGPALIVLFGLSISMFARDPLAGAVSLGIVMVYMAASVLITTKWIRPANLKSNALDSKIGGALADAVGGVAVVKSFGAEQREAARFGQTTSAWRAATIRTWNRFADNGLVMNVLLLMLQASLTAVMVRGWAAGRSEAGDVAFAVTSFMLMAGYLRNFGDMVRMLQKGIDDLADVAAYHRQDPQVADRAGAPAFRSHRGEIAFDHVTFRYKSQPKPVYEDFSLRIAPGERVALVGPTGSGKSTFVKLIQRLYDLEDGRVLIDGQDVSAVTQASLRQAIAVVPQDPALFHRTIAENIAYGRPDASPEDIVEAAKRARAHDFVMRLPKGYDTLVGERGVKLSGGERQRVAIARAFLTDAPILVLDEATSSLDVETEREVQAATEALMAGRTTIVIAHRLSTIRGADRILVFSGGRVVEEGRHGELVAQGGTYARLNAVAEGVG